MGLVGASPLAAEVKLPTIFTDNMVLQRDQKVPIWGTAAPAEKVVVAFLEQIQTIETGADGKWKVWFTPLPVTHEPFSIKVTGTNALEIKNVLVGDVWFCGGQSNMANPLPGSLNAKDEIAAAHFPEIRDYVAFRQVDLEPQADNRGRWKVCTPQNAPGFSGVAYFFAREIYQKYGIPIGIIENSLGATNIEAWMDHDALSSCPELEPWIKDWDAARANLDTEKARYVASLNSWGEAHPAEKAAFDAQLAVWGDEAQAAKAANKTPPAVPKSPAGMPFVLPVALARYYLAGYDPATKEIYFKMHPATAMGCFNGMTLPYIPYGIRGFLWFQGENNVNHAEFYAAQFAALIKSWRGKWGQGNIPFLFVQISNWGQPQVDPVETQKSYPTWRNRSGVREAQMLVSKSVPNTAMASAVDIGDAVNVHFPNKQDVGHRLALAARALSYGEKTEYEGPIYESMAKEGDKLRVKFSHVGGGLVAKDGKLIGFAIAGKDRQFVWADAVINGSDVILSSPKVPQPTLVYYGWGQNPQLGLYNQEALPASPFRSDQPAPPSAD